MTENLTGKKKGEALSMNVIVVAVIALIILIVLIVVFSGRMGIFNRGVNSCEDKGGQPYSGSTGNADCIQAGGTPSGPYFEEQSGKKVENTICCILSK
jgi:hypothetical protein